MIRTNKFSMCSCASLQIPTFTAIHNSSVTHSQSVTQRHQMHRTLWFAPFTARPWISCLRAPWSIPKVIIIDLHRGLAGRSIHATHWNNSSHGSSSENIRHFLWCLEKLGLECLMQLYHNSTVYTVNSGLSATVGSRQMLADNPRWRIIEQGGQSIDNKLQKSVSIVLMADSRSDG